MCGYTHMCEVHAVHMYVCAALCAVCVVYVCVACVVSGAHKLISSWWYVWYVCACVVCVCMCGVGVVHHSGVHMG